MEITKQQIKSIYAMGAGLHMVGRGHDDALHQLVGGLTGKDSVKSLDRDEAQQVIAELMHRMRGMPSVPPAPRKKPKEHAEIPGGVTEGQQRRIWALMYELKKFDRKPMEASLGDRLCGIIRRQFRVDATAKKPFQFLRREDGNQLIEILKKYCYNAEARHIREGGASG